ncbi:MAG: polyisoprenoid-binding protein [Flavobacteriales bacterium]|nr:MAG: polyisoprenoid-binding protein [Flavobacteriales bacterium]
MKKIILSLAVVATLSACTEDKKPTSESHQVETTKEGATFNINKEESKINWKGSEIFKGKEEGGHFGIITFQSADITVKDGKLESGKFVADMNTLASLDLKDEEKAQKLNSHLKNEDFFEVEKFPTATYEITKVSAAEENADYNTILDGNMTIKGITKPIQFKANVSVNENDLEIATAPQNINRQEFGVQYKSDVKDVIIKDELNVQVIIKANTQ